ncbi:hypothetical protein M595_0509 [Lyngbya aestuarii BL J]|uniref:Uncharacterized protein n=1 Tax=Lyngbya aestuarii BL J TaxID=1348334 RepID=U7QSU1_9CYAN|nr:hypothetical protein M595_0509 [Lyngbya aestuarii BL J]
MNNPKKAINYNLQSISQYTKFDKITRLTQKNLQFHIKNSCFKAYKNLNLT